VAAVPIASQTRIKKKTVTVQWLESVISDYDDFPVFELLQFVKHWGAMRKKRIVS
jgi:hypothetical protein